MSKHCDVEGAGIVHLERWDYLQWRQSNYGGEPFVEFIKIYQDLYGLVKAETWKLVKARSKLNI